MERSETPEYSSGVQQATFKELCDEIKQNGMPDLTESRFAKCREALEYFENRRQDDLDTPPRPDLERLLFGGHPGHDLLMSMLERTLPAVASFEKHVAAFQSLIGPEPTMEMKRRSAFIEEWASREIDIMPSPSSQTSPEPSIKEFAALLLAEFKAQGAVSPKQDNRIADEKPPKQKTKDGIDDRKAVERAGELIRAGEPEHRAISTAVREATGGRKDPNMSRRVKDKLHNRRANQ